MMDISQMHDWHASVTHRQRGNDEGGVAGVVLMMLKDVNSNEVIKNVKERIEQIRKTLPESVFLEVVN